MKKLYILLLVVHVFMFSAYGQYDTHIQAGAGIAFDQYHLTDEGGRVETGIPTTAYEFNLSQGILPNIRIETGLNIHEYYSGQFFKDAFPMGYSNELMSLQIPLRLQYRINLYKNALWLNSSLGYKLGIDTYYYPETDESSETGQHSTAYANLGDYEYTYDSYSDFSRFFHMAEMSIALEYTTDYNINYSLIGRYTSGFNKIIEHHTWYTYKNSEEYHAIQTSYGDYLYMGVAVAWKLSTIWQNAEKRKETRPLRLKKHKKAAHFPFYAGIEAASVSYASRNEGDVSGSQMYLPIFMAGTDFKTGLFFGYNLSDRINLETGLYAHLFNSSFTIHNEIDASFGYGGNSDVNFIQLPLRLHYRQLLCNDRLEIKPYAGLGLIVSNKSKGHVDTNIRYEGDSLIFDPYNPQIRPYYNDTISQTIASESINHTIGIQALAGLKLTYALSPRIALHAACRFAYGFRDLYQMEVLYISDNEISSGSTYYRGTNMALSAGLKYRFGEF